jgi:hypothetical protein
MLLGMSLGIPPLLSVGLLKDNEGSYLPICVKSDEYLNDKSQYHYWYFVSGLFAVMIVAILILIKAEEGIMSERMNSNPLHKTSE